MKPRLAFLVLALLSTTLFAAQPKNPKNPGQINKSLPEQLADLEARVAKLEGNITQADLVGTYSVMLLDFPLSGFIPGTPPRNAAIETQAYTGMLTLNADSSASLVANGCSFRLTQGTWAFSSKCEDATVTGTWSYANAIVTTDLDDLDLQLNVGAGGRLLTGAFAALHESDQSSDTFVFVMSRLQ